LQRKPWRGSGSKLLTYPLPRARSEKPRCGPLGKGPVGARNLREGKQKRILFSREGVSSPNKKVIGNNEKLNPSTYFEIAPESMYFLTTSDDLFKY